MDPPVARLHSAATGMLLRPPIDRARSSCNIFAVCIHQEARIIGAFVPEKVDLTCIYQLSFVLLGLMHKCELLDSF